MAQRKTKNTLPSPQAEKTLVYLPQAQGYEDVDPEEMGGGGEGRESHSFIFCSLHLKTLIPSSHQLGSRDRE